MRVVFFVLISIIMTSPAYALPSVTGKTYVDQPYGRVRRLLIERGLVPIKMQHEDPDNWTCFEGFCKRYPEVLYCSGAGVEGCMFVFSESGKYRIVTTIGEGARTVLSIRKATRDDIEDIKFGQHM